MSHFNLPPMPPAGAFDIRFASDRMLEVVTDRRETGFHVKLSGVTYPLIISSRSTADLGPVGLVVDGRIVNLDVPATIVGGASEVMISVGAKAVLPSNYALGQNYPNPFNPSTRITYALPEDAVVSVRIFTLLGQEVKTLLIGLQGAGEKVVSWDGTNNAGDAMSSGIYFYRMEARSAGKSDLSFTSVRKMLLVR